jgi:hypothetical protein
MGPSQPDMTVTPQEGTARLKPPITQATTSEVGQTREDMTEAFPVVGVTQQGSASVPPSQQGVAMAPVSKESSWDLTHASDGPKVWGGPRIEWADPQNPGATVFALDDAVERSEWRSLDSSLGGVAQLLTNTLSTLNDVASTGQV